MRIHPWRFGFSDIIRAIQRAQEFTTLEVTTPLPAPREAKETTIQWVDMRTVKRTKSRGKRKGTRPWDKITGLTLHQTAVVVKSAARCLNMPVHAVVLDDGNGGAIIVLLHDPTNYLWHGNGFNRGDIGIEIACRAAGIEGDQRTLWLPRKFKHLKGDDRLAECTEATDAQLEAARVLVKYYDDLVGKNGGALQFIHAHRQATKNRVSDPGSRIWGAVGEYARNELGLFAGPKDFQISDGFALPDAWTGMANGIRYNWKVDGRIEPG